MNSTDIKKEIILDNPNGIHGFKAFDPDWTCTPDTASYKKKQYSCPGMFETATNPRVCHHGMHFCERLEDVFNYYRTKPNKPKVAEVIAWGIVAKYGNKCSTNKLEIVREIPWEEVVDRTNLGADCTGVCNTGSDNAGDWNTGNYNTGDGNTGNGNTGDWNCTDFSTGCFCTEEPEILMFNKPSGMTLSQWRQHPACRLLWQSSREILEWITPEEANKILGSDNDFVCTVGHANTAMVLSDMLGRHIEMNRIRSSLTYGDTLIVGQLVSGRLPEGCTTLPNDAVFTFVKVTLQRKEEA